MSGDLSQFRREFYQCLTARADALFELCDAVLCQDGPVTSLVELSLAGPHRRGHGALYDGLAAGRVDISRLRRSLTATPLPRHESGAIVLAVDMSPWLRPDAQTSPARSHCHVSGRGNSNNQLIPGWPYSFIAALEPGRTSWTAILDVERVPRGTDLTVMTANQIRALVQRLSQAQQHTAGLDPNILIVFDAGYDITRLAWLLADLPVDLLGRIRSDRVYYPLPEGPPNPRGGHPARHGTQFKLIHAHTRTPDTDTESDTSRYGRARAVSWNELHQRLYRRAGWASHEGRLPIVNGTVIRLTVDHLPGERSPKPLWLWHSRAHTPSQDIDRLWRAYLRRFDLEHTFRFLKQTLGWTRPRVRTPDQGDRWTWLLIAASTQLRLARYHVTDLRRPWEKPVTQPHQLSPARVRRGFINIHRKAHNPASAPKPTRPGPGRPPGSKNKHRAPRPAVGKPTDTETPG
ncbi:NF041680 family putative transposase [Nocardia sp. NPDC058658]|uniref:NF041680 family putative transposase n=1 Tax=Nocardia sp. NPDC058658 TaxID=3346580 RepID=UPI00366340F3